MEFYFQKLNCHQTQRVPTRFRLVPLEKGDFFLFYGYPRQTAFSQAEIPPQSGTA